jgi:NDP-sugar pyrophosphorylase family protein
LKAVILAGGFGKRLRPLTESIPKPLVEIGGKTILERQIEWLGNNDIKEIILCIGFLKDKIIEYINNEKSNTISLKYVIEKEPLGTGGALLNSKELLKGEEEFIVMNGDIITDLDPSELKKKMNKNIGVLSLIPLRSQYGIVDVDNNGKITQFKEKPIISEYWVNAGVYMLNKKIFNYLDEKSSIEKDAFPELVNENKLAAVKFREQFWRSIEVVKDIEEVEQQLQRK